MIHRDFGGAAMAIHIYCTKCYTSNGLNAKVCSNCGEVFGRDKKYRVCVSFKGKRETRVVDNLTLARQKEATLKADLERKHMGIEEETPASTLAEVWAKYLPWAQEHKKTWDDDLLNYRKHLQPRFGKKRLDAVSALEVNRLKLDMTKGKTKDDAPYLSKRGKLFSASTVKHQLVLLQRLYKFAQGPDFKYKGETPFDHKQVTMPLLPLHPPYGIAHPLRYSIAIQFKLFSVPLRTGPEFILTLGIIYYEYHELRLPRKISPL
jgi:hypothetical protein